MTIPALAFNEVNASSFTDPQRVSESHTSAYLGVHNIRNSNQETDFRFKSAHLEVKDLIISAYSSTGVSYEREIIPGLELILPLNAKGFVESGGDVFYFHHRHQVFFHGYRQKKQTMKGSAVNINFSEEKLNSTRAALFGRIEKESVPFHTQSPLLAIGDISFSKLFESLFLQIDAIDANPKIFQKLNLDDSFYRLCAGLLSPDLFLADAAQDESPSYTRPEITKLCEFLSAHLTEPISLTQMEQISGLSARVLQRSFQKAFGLRPKQWLRRERLHAARGDLLNPHEATTITSLAYDFCFASPSQFARHYHAEFGELPSQTLMRK
mgnify:CR=1 FL=1